MAERLRIEVEYRNYRDLKPSETNARVMPARQYDQLVANIKRDGVLSSSPLVYEDRIISGHHRVRAAMEAEVEGGPCMTIKGEVSDARLRAIQLSHNAIAGVDDPAVLAVMLEGLPPLEQEYAAVDLIQNIEMPALGPALGIEPGVKVELEFMPTELDEVRDALDQIKDRRERVAVEPASLLGEFLEIFFLFKYKDQNNLSAPGTLVEMARLAKVAMDAEADDAEA